MEEGKRGQENSDHGIDLEENRARDVSDGPSSSSISAEMPNIGDTAMASLTPAANSKRDMEGNDEDKRTKNPTSENENGDGNLSGTGSSPLRIVDFTHEIMPLPHTREIHMVASEPGAYAIVSHTRYAGERNNSNRSDGQGLEMVDWRSSLALQDSGLVQAYPVSDPVGTATPHISGENHVHFQFNRKLTCILISVLAGIIIAIISSSVHMSQVFIRDPNRMEHQQIRQTILDAFGEKYFDNSQKKRALHWMIYEDPRSNFKEQGHHQSNLIQRFSLVAFYFQTSAPQPWTYCNPPEGKQSKTCYYRFAELDRTTEFMGTRWLTEAHECQWMGVECKAGTRAVTDLCVSNNDLTGSIPAEAIGMLTSIRRVALNANHLSGTLSDSLLQIKTLQTIVLEHNQLTGAITPQAFLMPSLTNLNLGHNQFTGSIPLEVGHYDGTWLLLRNNLLTGSIPREVYRATRLESLVVDNNLLTGTLSPEIRSLTHLSNLYFGGNPIRGHIASEIGLLQNLMTLEASRSNMGGTIPEELYQCRKLVNLALNKTQISGTISTRVGLLKALSHFHFEDTQISGTLPEELGSLSQLLTLTTSGNHNLTGSIPESICAHRYQRLKIVADCAPTMSTGLPAVFCPKGCCSQCCDTETKFCL